MRLADNNLVRRDSKKKYQRHGLARTVWLIIDLKVVLRELLGPANLTGARALRISKLSEAIMTGLRLSSSASNSWRLQRWPVVFYYEFCTKFRLRHIFITASLVSEIRKLGSSKPMTFATFQVFEVFSLLTIFWLFDNLDEFTTVSLALSLPPTTSSVPSFLGTKSDDLVVFNIEVSGAAIHLKPWMKRR